MSSGGKKESVYLMFNDMNSKYRFRAAKFVIEHGHSPIYPALMGDFFDVKQNLRKAKDARVDMIRKCDQVWVFGEANATMSDHIVLAKNSGKQIKYFNILRGVFQERPEMSQ